MRRGTTGRVLSGWLEEGFGSSEECPTAPRAFSCVALSARAVPSSAAGLMTIFKNGVYVGDRPGGIPLDQDLFAVPGALSPSVGSSVESKTAL